LEDVVKIILYNPPVFYYTGKHFDLLPSLGLAILARVLNDAGNECEVIDLEALGVHPNSLRVPDADLIGFTSPSAAMKGVRDCIASLRKQGYQGRIMVGGNHATLFPDEMGVDLVVTGECEGNIAQLIHVDGVYEGKRAPIEDIPSPDWDHHSPDVTVYKGQYEILHPRAGVSMWTRGCPFKCIYCADYIYNGQPTRYRPVERIVEDMQDFKRRGIDRVYVYDDEMVGTKLPDGWMKSIADKIQSLNITWITQGRCSKKHVTPELLNDMYRAGCRQIIWGVESFSQSVLNAVKKHITPEDIFSSLKVSKQAGMKNVIFMMIGNYKETENDLKESAKNIKLAYDMGLIDQCQTSVCKIMPGTELERISKSEGWYQPDTGGMIRMKQVTNATPWLTTGQISNWQARFKQACPIAVA
jgi:radical SAM superfamily enzyme YgiQ (UPF0313 family)